MLVVCSLLVTDQPLRACTVFVASDGKVTLVGDNEDFDHSYTQMWTVPRGPATYGVIYFGFGRGEYPAAGAALSARARQVILGTVPISEADITDTYGYPQQGINEKGLFFGGAATETVRSVSRKRTYVGVIVDYILKHARNVEEALELLKDYEFPSSEGHLLFADPSGRSFIWEAGSVVLPGSGRFQIITNFLQSVYPEEQARDHRYKIVDGQLRGAPELSHELIRSILSETQQNITQYSAVFDLTHFTIDLYRRRDFSSSVKLNIEEQLEGPPRALQISTLFE